MKKILQSWLKIIVFISVVTTFFTTTTSVFACESYNCDPDGPNNEYLTCIGQKKTCLENNLKKIRSEKITLTNTINLINGQISIQQLEIDRLNIEISSLEGQIKLLTERISGLAMSLDRLSAVLIGRVRAQYKSQHISALHILMSATSASQALAQYKYLTYTSNQIANAMERAELQRIDFDNQKQLKEEKQQELASKQKSLQSKRTELSKQKNEQQYLLQETNNSESQYQRELSRTLAEITAIQSIIAGKGSESKVGEIKAGDLIAKIIVGASTCSTGTHLHFEISKSGVNRDPASYLKPASINWSNGLDGPFGFGGDWDWPVRDPARITQGYGMTYYARVRRAYGGAPHTGIDLVSKSGSTDVLAVQDGTLYRGSIRCGGGLLQYVRVEHKNEPSLSTFYLHVNYI